MIRSMQAANSLKPGFDRPPKLDSVLHFFLLFMRKEAVSKRDDNWQLNFFCMMFVEKIKTLSTKTSEFSVNII